MKNCIVLNGDEVSRIVASFLAENGVKVQCYNIGGHTVYPSMSVKTASGFLKLGDVDMVVDIKETVELNNCLEKIEKKIGALKF